MTSRPFVCDVCRGDYTSGAGVTYTCRQCDYDECMSCFSRRPRHRHRLQLQDHYFTCDVCHLQQYGSSFACPPCNYDECVNCFLLRNPTSVHAHPLTYSFRKTYRCGLCSKSFGPGKSFFCAHDQCPACFSSRAQDFVQEQYPAEHSLFLGQLGLDGKYIVVGAPTKPYEVTSLSLIFGRKSLAGSLIGGIKETQEMLDFCGKHNIVSDIELIQAKDINTAYERVIKSDVKYRFVIDAGTF